MHYVFIVCLQSTNFSKRNNISNNNNQPRPICLFLSNLLLTILILMFLILPWRDNHSAIPTHLETSIRPQAIQIINFSTIRSLKLNSKSTVSSDKQTLTILNFHMHSSLTQLALIIRPKHHYCASRRQSTQISIQQGSCKKDLLPKSLDAITAEHIWTAIMRFYRTERAPTTNAFSVKNKTL